MSSVPERRLSLLTRGLISQAVIIASFSMIYMLYTYIIGDDFHLERGNIFDTAVNALFLSSFVNSGSVPPNMSHTSSLARCILAFNTILATLVKIYLITVD